MIPKKREEYQFHIGGGRPYEMNARSLEPQNDEERQKPVVINLSDINGQTGDSRVPKHYHPKRGRLLMSFTKYWSPEEIQTDIDDGFDAE